MQRLDFRLPGFVRLTWASDQARHHWRPRLDRLRDGLAHAALARITAGRAGCAIACPSPSGLPGLTRAVHDHGLDITGLDRAGLQPSGGFDRLLLGRSTDLARFMAGQWQGADGMGEQGRLLGLAPCCADARKQRHHAGWSDAVWPWASQWAGSFPASPITLPDGLDYHPLLARIGLNPHPDIPCHPHCPHPWGIMDGLAPDDAHLLRHVLDWPVHWSALHGMAQVKTPVLRFICDTDALAAPLAIHHPGKSWPDHGARGLGFLFLAQID